MSDLALVTDRETPRAARVWYRILLAIGDEWSRISGRSRDLLRESDPRTAVELLPENEEQLGLRSGGTNTERQARIVSHILKDTGVRPVDFQTALSAILGLDAVDIVVIETSRATAILVGDDTIIYQFHIYRNPALPGAYDLAEAQVIVDAMAHSHTQGRAIESISCKCDDPLSLTDRDLLGV